MWCLTVLLTFLPVFLVSSEERCSMQFGHLGKCVPIHDCPYALDLLKQKIKTDTCSFNGTEPIVCCPETLRAEKECARIMELHPTKGTAKPVSLIVVGGGIDAKPKMYPHMAALGYGSKDNIVWNCGGSLISETFVLTAAHCLHSKEDGVVKWIRLGELDFSTNSDDAEPQDFEIKTMHQHPDFRPPKKYNDIALLELDKPVRITDYVIPACLHTGLELRRYADLIATGWGLLEYAGSKSDRLQAVELQSYSKEECGVSFPARKVLPDGIVVSQLCSGHREKDRDTCPGDSGGPLQTHNLLPDFRDRYRGFLIVGVTSFGKACAIGNEPGVYTRVASFIPWIESVVWPSQTVLPQ